jgi:exonuclease III
MEIIRFMTLNVGMNSRLGGLVTRLQKRNVNVIFLQELNVDENFTHKPGIGMVWKLNLPMESVVEIVEGRAQRAKLGPYFLLNVYAPSGSYKRMERRRFYDQDMFREIRLNIDKAWIFGGDFNAMLSIFDGVGFPTRIWLMLLVLWTFLGQNIQEKENILSLGRGWHHQDWIDGM